MANKKSTVFESLNGINVNDKTEQKGNLTYLSWAWAWAEAKKLYPSMTRTVYERENGINYFTDGNTGWVKVGITIDDLEYIDYLPIMDFKNKSIPVVNIKSFDVNKAIQRSTTKALALHGLGLYIYAGEDLPEGYEPPAPVKPKLDAKRLNGALTSIKEGNYTISKLKETFELTDAQTKKVDKFVKDMIDEDEAKVAEVCGTEVKKEVKKDIEMLEQEGNFDISNELKNG